MKNMQTPLHKVQGFGSSHSGTGHFWHERLSAMALIPLTLWFVYSVLGLAGTSEVTTISYLAHWWNALPMMAFVIITLYHIKLGLQVVIDDYVHSAGGKVVLMLLARTFAIACGALSLYALLEIARVF